MSKKKYATEEERKAAKAASSRAHYVANREKVRARSRAYDASHRAEKLERWRAYSEMNREEIAARGRAHYAANREAIKLRHKAYRDANRDKHAKYRADNRATISAQRKALKYLPEVRAARRLRSGLPLPLRAEPDFCELCGALGTKHLGLDHCHTTGIFRGWLCDRCNRGLGFFDDNIEGLERAIAYLKRAYGVA